MLRDMIRSSLAAIVAASIVLTACHVSSVQKRGKQWDINTYNSAVSDHMRELNPLLLDIWESLRLRNEDANAWSKAIADKYLMEKYNWLCQDKECVGQFNLFNAWRDAITFPDGISAKARVYNRGEDIPFQVGIMLSRIPFRTDVYFRYNPSYSCSWNKAALAIKVRDLLDGLVQLHGTVKKGLRFDYSRAIFAAQQAIENLKNEFEAENIELTLARHHLLAIKEYVDYLPDD